MSTALLVELAPELVMSTVVVSLTIWKKVAVEELADGEVVERG